MKQKQISDNDNKVVKRKSKKESLNTVQIYPWSSNEEWEAVCVHFNNGNYKKVISEIEIWKERVTALPVGVESTLFLLQAIIYDIELKNLENSDNNVNAKARRLCDDEARSLYALAVIRYLNHVSHLATREIGGITRDLSMSNLASHVNIPDWIVNLRHECTHGMQLPSLQTFRLASDFIKTWLSENYWISSGSTTVTPRNEVLFREEQQEEEDCSTNVSSYASQLISAFIASRVYKLRGFNTITDPSVIQLLPNDNSSHRNYNTKQIIILFKSELREILAQNPISVCDIVAQEMIPPLDFYTEFSTLFNDQDPFAKLTLLWSPLLEILQDRKKLAEVCQFLGEIHTSEFSSERCRHFSSLWINLLLDMIEKSGKTNTKKLAQVLHVIARRPTEYTSSFIDRLLNLTRNHLGVDRLEKLETLMSIWTDPSPPSKKRKLNHSSIVSLEDIISGDSKKSRETDNSIKTVNWQLDTRDMEFWRNKPLGSLTCCIILFFEIF